MTEQVPSMVDGPIMLSRNKPLNTMTIYELISWLGDLCRLWCLERTKLSTGLPEIEEELLRTISEVEKALQPPEQEAYPASEEEYIEQ